MNLVTFHLLFESNYLNQFLLFNNVFHVCNLWRREELGMLEIIGSNPENQFGHLQRGWLPKVYFILFRIIVG